MISEAKAWANLEKAQERMDFWFEQYNELYEGSAERLQKQTWDRQKQRITIAQARAQVDALTSPTGYSKVYEALQQYRRFMDEARFWKDMWQAVRDHDRSPAATDW